MSIYFYICNFFENSTELHYYANIDDDVQGQSNTLEMILQLWRVDRYINILGVKVKKWDKKLVGGTDIYHINQVGDSEVLSVTKYDDQMNKAYEVKVQVITIGVEKANTLAIYETNGTALNGHYQEQERMNMIQLYVNDSGAGTPFVEGPNVIAIPTSLFTETVFNAYVQNETLSETPIYSADDEIFMFISVGRDGNTEQACGEIDFIFIRFDISSEDAMEVLTLLLTCLVNETTNETAIVYSYISAKLNDTTAVMMNLPFSVLGFIPWFCNFTESPMGSKPETKDDVFWKPLKTLCSWTIGLIVMAIMIPAMIIAMLTIIVVTFLLEKLPILQYILWLIICAAILIFAFIMLGLTIFGILIGYGSMLLMIPIIILSGGTVNPGLMSFEFTLRETTMKTSTSIEWKHNDYLKLYLPVIVREERINGSLVSQSKEGVITDFTEYQEFELNYTLNAQGENGPISSQGEDTRLINGIVKPKKGDTQETFKFTVTYIDLNNTAPEENFPMLRVMHDSWKELYRPYEMEPVDVNDLNYTDGKEYEIELKFNDIGEYEFYFVVEVNISGTIQSIETNTSKFYVRLSIVEIVGSFFNGINLICTFSAIAIAALGLASKNPYGACITGIGFIIYIILIYSNFLLSKDEQSKPQKGFGMAVGSLITFSLLLTLRCGRKFSIDDTSELKTKFIKQLLYLIIPVLGIIFLSGIDIILSMIGNIITSTISMIILWLTTRATVALLWGKKGAIKGPQNVSIISKGVYYVIMGMLFAFSFLFLFSAVQKLSEV